MRRPSKLFPIILACILVIVCLVPTVQAADTSIKVSVMVIGDSRHAAGKHSQYQVWMDKITYSVADGSSAADLILMALKANGMKYNTDLFGIYINTIYAPANLGGYKLSDGMSGSGNGGGSGWMFTVNKPGDSGHEFTNDGMKDYQLSNGDFIVVHYIDDYNEIDWSNFPTLAPSSWLSAAPLPQAGAAGSGDSGGGGGGGGGTGGGGTGGGGAVGGGGTGTGTGVGVSVLPKEYTSSDLKKPDGTNIYQLMVEKNSVIKAGALVNLPEDSVLYADMVSDNQVQFRIKFSSPSSIDSDIKAGMGFVSDTNSVKKLFSKHYKNKLQVLAFDNTVSWGQTVGIMVYSGNLDGFDSSTWKLYSYDKAQNLYTEISYQVDKNQYIHFSMDNVNPVVFSDGALLKK